MLLSDVDIQYAMEKGTIQIHPSVSPGNIRPSGIRVHLADQIACPEPNTKIVDLSGGVEPGFRRVELGAEGFVLSPGQFILGSTVEHVCTSSDFVGRLDGRSTVARLGIMIHCGSSTIDNVHGEFRSITLEILNVGPFAVRLRRGDPIGMLVFQKLLSPISQPSSAQYRAQSEVGLPSLRKAG